MHQFDTLDRDIELRSLFRFGPGGRDVLHQDRMRLRADQAIAEHRVIFTLLEPQGGAADEALLQFFEISGVLQLQALQRRLHDFDAAIHKVTQNIRNAPPVNASNALLDKVADVSQHQSLSE